MKKLLLGIGSFAAAAAPVAAVVACGDDDNTNAITVDGTTAKATITVSTDKASNKAQYLAIATAIGMNTKVDAAEIKVVSEDGTITETITIAQQTATNTVTANAAVALELATQINLLTAPNASFAGCFDMSA